ncbi:uncharacterized protein LOC119588519 [Penaeus monodon]|uniref:uncharacterized protein LOC119588519 n=1 Tax=Penaeus monodon TaxID=6687 RepID=UPI0018A78A99|nr:uncharacterized protein LOC119588519 [Penaeus monodon]
MYGSTHITVLKKWDTSDAKTSIYVTYECNADPVTPHVCVFVAPKSFVIKKGIHVPHKTFSEVVLVQEITRENEGDSRGNANALGTNTDQSEIYREETRNTSEASQLIPSKQPLQRLPGDNVVVLSHCDNEAMRDRDAQGPETVQETVLESGADVVNRQTLSPIHTQLGIQETTFSPSLSIMNSCTLRSTNGNSDPSPISTYSQGVYRKDRQEGNSPEHVVGFNWGDEEHMVPGHFLSLLS